MSVTNSTTAADERPIVWFDIDNTLYSASTKISQAMGTRIHAYFVNLGLGHEEASELHLKYYTQYGLALRGLTRHHDVDPIDFDRQCDGSLPLEDMISYDPSLRKLFEDIDRTKVRVWALTNAYRPHAERVLRILKLDDQVDGLVYCDYSIKDFVCKPEPEFYQMAMKQANLSDPSKCYFIDDNRKNVDAARDQGWARCVHFCEKGLEAMEGGRIKEIDDERESGAGDNDVVSVTTMEDLRKVWPEIFKK
ncbi:Haloacid dehalogenase-like hydrolase-domain-containing protein [Crassisporium funariophilum]|nr:Haloacid dehalogenase-like hydrolase-domain-containing protein [Crassisporium funariophilum]